MIPPLGSVPVRVRMLDVMDDGGKVAVGKASPAWQRGHRRRQRMKSQATNCRPTAQTQQAAFRQTSIYRCTHRCTPC